MFICLTCIIVYGLVSRIIFFVLYIFVVLLVYYKSIMDFFFLSFIYLCYFFCFIYIYIYIYIYIETHCHIFIVINTKLVISHHIWKNILGLKPTKLHHTYDYKTKVQYGTKNGQKLHQSAPWTPLILIEASNVHYLWPNALSNISFTIMTLSLLPWTITVYVFSRIYSKLIR